jgi:mannosyl-oligosaccharide glucosidase
LTAQLEQKAQIYNDRFATTFRLPAEYSSPEHTAFAQAITSNLIGGIGYFYGSSLVDRSFRHSHDEDGEDDDEDEEEVPIGVTQEPERELLTATPSRSFFPRGFYWDEGFHLAVVAEWDNDLRWVRFDQASRTRS